MGSLKIYRNGNVRTMNDSLPSADSFVTEGDRFAYVGSESGARDYAKGRGFRGEAVDLCGRLVIPGLTDSHLHLALSAKSMLSVKLWETRSIAELKSRLKEGLSRRKPSDEHWLEGERWNQDLFEDGRRFPTRSDLDEVSPDVPIMIIRACYHIGVLNSAALESAGISRETVHSYGGLAGVLPGGEPDGIVKESLLTKLMQKQVQRISKDRWKDLLLMAQEKLLAQGLTTVISDDLHVVPKSDYEFLIDIFRGMEREGRLKVRVRGKFLLQRPEVAGKYFVDGYRAGWGSDLYRIAFLKILADGSLGARTAAMRRPYRDDPSTDGIALFSREELEELIEISHRNGTPVAIHAIGDRAAEMALDALEHEKANRPSDIRDAIVHCQITDYAMLDRFAELDVLALVQPIFIDSDMRVVADRVGEELASTSYAWKSMMDRKIHVSLGTDSPVEGFEVMPNIYSAVSRRNVTGDSRIYLPNERLTMYETIRAYTVEGAYATGEEGRKGDIAPGKLADFIVLSRDLFSLENEEDILGVRVLETYVGGELAYKAGQPGA
jgi:predicted amidohydrolase YtcJ